MKVGVAFLDFGGPSRPEELEPFLAELLADVLPGPRWLKRSVIPTLARARARSVAPNYEMIGWSPLVETHRAQVGALQRALGDEAPPIVSGMMFTPPTMRDAARELREHGVDAIVALPNFPHYSFATTGAAFQAFWEALVAEGMAQLPVHWVGGWFDHPAYIEALATTIREGAERTPGEGELHLLFTPHGLPVSYIRRGDPYPEQIRTTVRLVMQALGERWPWHLGWQSRVGPVRWLTPGTPDELDRLGAEGVKRVCMVPVSFAAEHVETLHEIDIEYADHARKVGIEHFGRAPALGLQPAYIACLADLVRSAMARFGRHACVRCLHPKPDAHRRRGTCPNCRFVTPAWLRESASSNTR